MDRGQRGHHDPVGQDSGPTQHSTNQTRGQEIPFGVFPVLLSIYSNLCFYIKFIYVNQVMRKQSPNMCFDKTCLRSPIRSATTQNQKSDAGAMDYQRMVHVLCGKKKVLQGLNKWHLGMHLLFFPI